MLHAAAFLISLVRLATTAAPSALHRRIIRMYMQRLGISLSVLGRYDTEVRRELGIRVLLLLEEDTGDEHAALDAYPCGVHIPSSHKYNHTHMPASQPVRIIKQDKRATPNSRNV